MDADQMASGALYEILRTRGQGEFADRRPFEYRVINPLDIPVRSIAYLPLNAWDAPAVKESCRVIDDKGKEHVSQTGRWPGGFSVRLVVDLAAREERGFKLVPRDPSATQDTPPGEGFENSFYRAAWQKDKGIVSLIDLTTGREVLDRSAGALGGPIYQIFPGANRSAAGHDHPRKEVTAGLCAAIRRTATGSLYEQWEFEYHVPGATQCSLLTTFYRGLPQIDLTLRLFKTDVRDPEGMYAGFPLAIHGGVWHLDKPGAPIRPGLDQLPQACCDYYCVQHGAALAGNDSGAVLTTLDAPLVHIGAMRLWDYTTKIEPTGPLYSWLTNNQWDTNFRITCGGMYDFRYVLEVGREFADAGKALARCRALSYPPIVTRA